MNRKWTVYLLIDPRDGEIRYVGASKLGVGRLSAHIQESYLGISASGRTKAAWIHEVLMAGYTPIAEPLIICESKDEMERLEQVWINRLRLAGCNLTNRKNSHFFGIRIVRHDFKARATAAQTNRKEVKE